jgi:hypothetical protein
VAGAGENAKPGSEGITTSKGTVRLMGRRR